MEFLSKEKQAIFSVIVGLIHADGRVATDEVCYMEQLLNTIKPTEYELAQAGDMEPDYAINILKGMTDQKKLAFGLMMHEMISADNNVAESELKLFNLVCYLTGIDKLIKK